MAQTDPFAQFRTTKTTSDPFAKFRTQQSEPQKKGRLASAKEGFLGSLSSAKKRFGEGARIQRERPEEGPFGQSGLKFLAAAGDVVASPFAGLAGFAQPEIEKGVTAVIEKTPQSVKSGLGKISAATPAGVKETAGDVLSASSLFALTGLGKQAAKTTAKETVKQSKKGIVKEAVKKTGKAVEKSGRKSAGVSKSSMLDDLVRGKSTVKKAEEAALRSREVGAGPFKRTIVELAPDEEAAKHALSRIRGKDAIKASDTAQGVLNKAQKAATREANNLIRKLNKKDVIFPKKELRSRVAAMSDDLAQNPFLTENKAAIKKMLNKVDELIENAPAKGSSLLKTRKDFDKWMRSQKKNLFGGSDDAMKSANREIRSVLNDFLAEKAKGSPVASSLRKQSSLLKAVDKVKEVAAKEAKTAPGRAFQNLERALGNNARIKEIVGALALGGGFAAGAGPAIAGGLGALATAKGVKALVANPQNRILIGKMLQELSKMEAKAALGAEANALKQRIQQALDEQPETSQTPSSTSGQEFLQLLNRR